MFAAKSKTTRHTETQNGDSVEDVLVSSPPIHLTNEAEPERHT